MYLGEKKLSYLGKMLKFYFYCWSVVLVLILKRYVRGDFNHDDFLSILPKKWVHKKSADEEKKLISASFKDLLSLFIALYQNH